MRRYIYVFFVLVCVMSFCGCKEDFTKVGQENTEHFSLHSLGFEAPGYIINESVYIGDRYIYYAVEKGDEEYGFDIHRYDISEHTDSVFVVDLSLQSDNLLGCSICSVQETDDGGIVVFLSYIMYHEEEDRSYRDIDKIKYDNSGNEISHITLESSELISIMTKCFEDNKGITHVSTFDDEGTGIYNLKYDEEGKLAGKMKQDNAITHGCIDNNGEMIVSCLVEDGYKLGYVDYSAERVDTKPFEQFNKSGIEGDVLGIYDNYMVLEEINYINVYDLTEENIVEMINLKECNIDSNQLVCVRPLDNGSYICVLSLDSGDWDIAVIDKTDNVTDKEVIRMAGVFSEDSELKVAVNEYNRSNDEYRIDYVCYEENGEEELLKDIVTGNVPDIYIMTQWIWINLVAKGMLEDMTPYIDSDSELNRNYFIDGYLDAVSYGEKQYYLMKRVWLSAILGNKDDIGNYQNGWNINDFLSFAESKTDGRKLWGNMAVSEQYKRLLNCNIDCFMDYESGKCDFDTDVYRNILKLCSMNETTGYEEWETQFKNKEIVFGNGDIEGVRDIQYNALVCDGNDMYIGYPSEQNSGIFLKSRGSTFAISSESDKKDMAWEIIKYFMTGKYMRYDHVDNNVIPVSKHEFDMMIKDFTAAEKFTADDGCEIEPQNVYIKGVINIGPATSEDTEKLCSLIKNSVYMPDSNRKTAITEEHVQEYLSGKKSLDDTVRVIQDKMTKYFNENR